MYTFINKQSVLIIKYTSIMPSIAWYKTAPEFKCDHKGMPRRFFERILDFKCDCDWMSENKA